MCVLTYILHLNPAASQLISLALIDESFGLLFNSIIVHWQKAAKRLVN